MHLAWCKHCTVLEVTTNVLKLPMTALCVIAAQRLIFRPVLIGTLFVTTHGLHFQALHPLSFLFICTLHWCKYCTVLEVTTNVRKFPMTALCGITAQGLICRPVRLGTLFAPTQYSHFQALHALNFLFICTLHWCKHCTMLEIAVNVRKFPMTSLCGITANGHICSPVLFGALLAPTQRLHFQSLHPLSFHFHIHLALVQALYRARDNNEYPQISNDVAMRICSKRTYLQSRPRLCAFGTDPAFIFSVTPSS